MDPIIVPAPGGTTKDSGTVSDYDVELIADGLLIPNERTVQHLAEEVKHYRKETHEDKS